TIPTSEEVGPNPVDTYRREDITRLGVRSATDLIQKLPAATGSAINENVVNSGDGRVEINLRGLLAKETLVLQDGRRLAPVGFAEFYNRAANYSRDVDLSSTADFTRFGGQDARSGEFAGHVGPPPFLVPPGAPDSFVYQPNLNGGALTPTPHAFPNVASDPQYVPFASLPREQRRFNFAALTPAVPAVDREYLYGSLDRKICDQYLEVFADFK